MFTGIIEEMGEITAIAPSGDGWRLTVRAPRAAADAVHGESIAVSGVCLTVVGSTADTFDADVMKQTLDVSAIGSATVGTRVNIEKAMPVGARLGARFRGFQPMLGITPRTRPAIEAWYEKNIVAAPAEREAHARHIIAESERQAAKIAAEIKDGKSFDAAAEEYRAPGSSGDDGDLGWFRREDMVPEIAEPVFSMKPGDVSGPVQTQFGWHVIQLVGFRDLPKPELEEAHEEIVRRIARDEGQKLMEKLRADAKIEIIGAESAAPSSGRPQLVLPAQE
ncbi:MAG: riboflavin synthase [Actinobacteria bacterium HGW-Actinobacteria-11]|nr:MAG: riboflavin synthase [Actinobacteria bacterium HGW-Actinobacteria-11]